MLTFSQLKDSIRRQVFPSGEPESLISSHDLHFQEVLALISKWVEGEHEQNVSTFQFCKTSYKCGMTIVPVPRGVITRVWTVCADWCQPVFYYPVGWPQVECEGQRVRHYTGLTSSGKALPLGFQDADASTDSKCGRAMRGCWAVHRSNLYIAPYIQSTEMVVVEWDGVKNLWEETDPVSEEQDYRATVKLFFQGFHERDYGDMARAKEFHNPTAMFDKRFAGSADLALADLMWYDREKSKQRQDTGGCQAFPGYCRSNSLIPVVADSCTVPATPGPLIIAHVGNFGSGNADAAAVASLVSAMGPTAVIASAPNAYNSDIASQNYDDEVGKGYHRFISPYVGNGDGAAKNAFWPAPGTVDWSHDGNLSTYGAFFALPNNGRYYDVCLGPIHLFVLDALSTEPDGATETSAQGQWLKAKLWLARNEPTWKIVLLGDEVPYSTLGGTAARIWSFRSWGADLVLSGLGNYERILKAGLNFINNGSGGRTLQTTGASAVAGRQFYDQSHFGAGRIIATRCSIRYEFIDVAGAILDSVQLSRPKLGDCAEAVVGTLEASSIMTFLPPVTTATGQQVIFSGGGDPNGVVTPTGPLPCIYIDETNKINWVKDDGVISAFGWH